MMKVEKEQYTDMNQSEHPIPIKKPSVAIIRVLEACNAGCFMCAYSFSKDSYRYEREKLQKVLLEGAGGLKLIRFTGGEPLLLENISELLSDIKKADIATSIITNGWFIAEKVRANQLVDLDQIIVSVDGPSAEKHNKFRRLPNLFENLIEGVRTLKATQPKTIVRVNTVVGHHNLHLLTELYDLLTAEGVNQWSLIPLKRTDGTWGKMPVETIIEKMAFFNEWVKTHPSTIEILGYGLQLYGRTEAEIRENWKKASNLTPLLHCNLVDQIRYYVPKENLIFPCNCIPHRSGTVQLGENYTLNSFSGNDLIESRTWLKQFGPQKCRGCEPINAALADGIIDLEKNIFGF